MEQDLVPEQHTAPETSHIDIDPEYEAKERGTGDEIMDWVTRCPSFGRTVLLFRLIVFFSFCPSFFLIVLICPCYFVILAKPINMAKRKCSFRFEYSQEFSFIKSSNKGNDFVYSTICNVDISLASAGISSVKKHIDTIKHSSSQQMITSTQSLGLFIKERYSPISLKISAAEGTFAFHTVKHHHSFRTMDCTSNLLPVCFSDSDIAKNFHSTRTKTEAIITGVLAPMSIEEVLSELQTGIAFSLSTDASNHAELKTFLIIIRYFNSSGVLNKFLDLC
ncbi:hypothetical protein LOD99_10563 [Oopsacas minuta]|uniref:Uncharacterized protein n=1 Tax=Oopsacas minuta TaxID=111878 RepID=A0AAV7KG78_9METZ|nr:hypothetical protein LOD99_10563 [Oopsacas minuta]